MSIFVGVPTINNLRYLQKTLDSIEGVDDSCILVVDNGSEDETHRWVATCRYRKILNMGNLGVATAWNQIIDWGLTHDDCEILFILNNDIVLHPDCLMLMTKSVLAGKGFVSGRDVGSDPGMLQVATRPETRYSPKTRFACFGFTPETIGRVGLFDERFRQAYFEDVDYRHRMELEGIDCATDTWALYSHYHSRSIAEGGVRHEPWFSQNKRFFEKKWGFPPPEQE